MSESLISHALNKPLYLKNHIEQVMKASKYLVSKKHLNFKGLSAVQIEKIIILITVCHDFGKSTVFFQDYIHCKMNGHDYPGNEKDKSHSLISGLFGWYMAEEWIKKNENIENRWKVFLPFAMLTAIAGHHGSYSSIEDIISAVSEGIDSNLLPRQIENIKQEIFSYSFEEVDLNDGINFNLEAVKHIQKQLRKFHREYHKEILENQIEQRIFGLLLYSILLESDKAYLASDNPEQYERESIDIPDNIVDKFIESLDKSAKINEEREKAYCVTTGGVEQFPLTERIHSVTLPTGLGKTLLAASWAIKLRARLQKNGIIPKLIVSLPFLSIIEQTDKIYKKFLNNLYEHRLDRLYTASYSISDFEYKDGLDVEERSDNSVDFYLSTWNSEIIVTTFDQLLYSIFSLKAKHLMRFHNLFNSILIFDEIQALPSDLWKPFEFFFKKLAEVGNTHILLMSATQPDFFPGAIERVPEHREYFNNRNRVNLHICPKQLSIKDFIENLPSKLNDLYDRSVMIVLNTRMSSKCVYNSVKQAMDNGSIRKRPLVYLSSYVTPAQRIRRIERIHKYLEKCKNPLIITTQCIEAGVDIDIDYIIRD
ncbi:MAG: CRISPR-associated helicase Cas3', partial [bacterium]